MPKITIYVGQTGNGSFLPADAVKSIIDYAQKNGISAQVDEREVTAYFGESQDIAREYLEFSTGILGENMKNYRISCSTD